MREDILEEYVTFGTYGNYASNGYGANTIRLTIGSLSVYHSYSTVVAFSSPEDGLVVCKNSWSRTTGKHLNWIDNGNKSSRLPRDIFIQKYEAAIRRHVIPPRDLIRRKLVELATA